MVTARVFNRFGYGYLKNYLSLSCDFSSEHLKEENS